MKRIVLSLAAIAALFAGAPAFSASSVSQSVAVCDPKFPDRCIKPAADGSIATTGSGGGGGNDAASATGSAVPAKADYQGVNIGGTLRGQSGVNPTGTTYAGATDTTSVAGTTVSTGAGATGTGTQRVGVAQDTTTIAGSAPGTAGTPSANVVTVQGVTSGTPLIQNQTQVNSVAISTGAGATGTGTQRVGVAQDTTTIAGAAPGTAGTASSNVLTIQGVTSMTPVQVSQATAANLNATVVNAAGSAIMGKVGIDQTTPGTTNGVQLTGDGFTTSNYVSGVITSAMTSNTSTLLIASPGASLRNYITHIACYNTGAAGTLVNVQDGSGGTVIYQLAAGATYGGTSATLPVPLRQPTTATGLYVVNVSTTTVSTTCTASGYKGT